MKRPGRCKRKTEETSVRQSPEHGRPPTGCLVEPAWLRPRRRPQRRTSIRTFPGTQSRPSASFTWSSSCASFTTSFWKSRSGQPLIALRGCKKMEWKGRLTPLRLILIAGSSAPRPLRVTVFPCEDGLEGRSTGYQKGGNQPCSMLL
jgi:hypothetical protein